MTNWFKIIMVVCSIVLPARAGAEAAGDDCDCPKLSCNFECEYEQSVTFYTEKCAGGTRVRSCARPTCLPLPSAPPQCTQAQKSEAEPERSVASVKESSAPENAAPVVVGFVKDLEGRSWVVGPDSGKMELKAGTQVHETDRVMTGAGAKVEILFNDGNLVTLTANSELELSKLKFSEDVQKRQTLLHLIKGRVRSKVNQKYEGTTGSYFRVKTRAAVAGVRGTDYVVTLDQVGNDLVTKVETLSGSVELYTPLREDKLIVKGGQTGSYVATGMARLGAASEDIEADFAARGYWTQLTNLNEGQINAIDAETTVRYVAAARRKPSSSEQEDGPICADPPGKYNQCSWTCENNPAGEKRCRSDLPQVNCVRRVCNANGAWSAPARLPAAFGGYCEPSKVIVADCDF